MRKFYILIPFFVSFLVGNAFSQCDIAISETSPCAASPVNFSVISPSGSYAWDLNGDGFIDIFGTNVTYSFPPSFIDVNYTVTLYQNGVACSTLDVMVLGIPDPTIGVIPGSGILEGNLIRVCSGQPNVSLEIYNSSTTYNDNATYEFNWGDGTIETYNNTTFSNISTISHDYTSFGYFNITLTVTGVNGCVNTQYYTLYNGGNPSVGLANPGNTVGLCAPATIDFPITNTTNNPTGTIYTVYINGQVVALYTQENLPSVFTYTFDETSCNQATSTGNYQNAFDVQILASNPCGSTQATIEPIEVSSPPEVLFVSDEPSAGCEDETYTFTNSSGNLGEVIAGECTSLAPSWTITPGIPGVHWEIVSGNTFASDEIEIVFLIPGEYTIEMTVNSPSCGSGTYSENITVFDAPDPGATGGLVSASAPATSDDCSPSYGIFTNTSTGDSLTYQWNISPGTGWEYVDTFNQNSEHLEVLFTQPGEYALSLTATNFCGSDTWDTTLVVAGVPEITFNPIPNQCGSATFDFDPSMVTIDGNYGVLSTVEWSFPGAVPSSSTETYPTGIYYENPGTYTIEVTIENQCGYHTASQTFEIEPEATVDAGPDETYCANIPPFVITSGAPTGGYWTGAGVDSVTNTFDPSVAGVGTHTLTYTLQQGVCLSTDTKVITILEIPEIQMPSPQLLCINDLPYDLSAATPVGGVWSGAGINSNTFDPAMAGIGIHTITYTYGDPGNGCENSESIEMEVVPLPEIIVNDTTYCFVPGIVALPTVNPAGGNWSGPGVVGNNFDPEAVGGVGSYTVVYTYSDNNNCENSEDVIITLIEPSTIEAGSDFEVCIDELPIDLSQIATPAGGTWNANGSAGLNGSVFDPGLAGDGIHTLTYSVGTGNCQVYDDINITVHPLPIVDAGADFEICMSENSVSLSGNPAGGQWSSANGGVIVGNIFNPNASGEGLFALTYTYVDPNGCENSDDLFVTVHPLPVLYTNDTLFCNTPGTVSMPFAFPQGGVWSGPGVVNNEFNPEALGNGTFTVTYTYEDANGCSNSSTASITVVPPANIDAGEDQTVCIDDVSFQLSGYYPVNGTWSGTGIIDVDNGIFDPAVAGAGTHEITYSYGVGNCYVEDSKLITVVDLLVDAGQDEASCFTYDAYYLTGYEPAGGIWSGQGITDGQSGVFDPNVAGDGTHILTYTYTDPNTGCVRSDTKSVTIHPMEEAAFNLPPIACKNETIQFENLSNPSYGMFWSFGLGNGTSTAFSPTYSYDVAGTYTVTLIVGNEFGCLDTVAHDIVIADVPSAYFEPDTSDLCVGQGFTFTNGSVGDSLSYFWEFGDSFTSSEEDPGTIFLGQGNFDTTYVITLTVQNLCGSSTYQDVVAVYPIPDADFGISPLTDCSPLLVDFANTTTGSASDYYWDFGNGNTSDEQFPETQAFFTDSSFSIYTVTLYASNICGVDTATTEVLVESANVTAVAEPSVEAGCAPLTVDFYNFSTPLATIDWDFGDGNTSSEEEPTHTYAEPGEYTVIQYANSDCGYDTTTINIVVYPSPEVYFEHVATICAGEEVSFLNNSKNTSGNFWDFGDGTTSTINNPTHTYAEPGTYTITLTGISIFNQCESVFTSTITVLELPEASFEPSTTYGCAPLTVDFINHSTGALFYQWTFGDGNTSIEEAPTHVFEEAGTYEVTLLATDGNGCYEDFTIYNIIVQPKPDAAFDFEREELCGIPAVVNFENMSEGAIDFEWHFGEGGTSVFTSPTHTFTESGTFEVTLIARNQFACPDTFVTTLDIYDHPSAGVEIESMNGCEPLEVTFNNTSSHSNEYYWDFGDGSTSTESDPVHTYSSRGTYEVSLIANINSFCPDTIILDDMIEVYPTPQANFEAFELADDGTYEMTNMSVDASSYIWEFSDGNTSDEVNPTHRFMTNGVHQIYLEASNEYDCVDDTLVSFTPDFVKGLFIPNAFSPDQGVGDVRLFKPNGIGLKEYHIRVYSTYGQLLWESTAIDDQGRPVEAWDGIVDGKMLPQDVYVWRCSAVFEDGSNWGGQKNHNGHRKTIGSLALLR